MNSMTCDDARELLQEHHDQGRQAPSVLQGHLDDCPSCRRFHQFLGALGANLGAQIDAASGQPAVPVFNTLTVLARSRRRTRAFIRGVTGLAAALVMTAGGVIGFRMVREAEVRQYVSRETQLFVDDLFAEPLLEGIELASFADQGTE
jgi:predicted anti-sigma-YlaC factor YlaD